MYKLYYDGFPGDSLHWHQLCKSVPGYRQTSWGDISHVHTFMSFLGINHSWTNNINDPDAVVVLDVDSAPADTITSVMEFASKTYRKSIVMSATEPLAPGLLVDVLAEQYPNVLLVCSGDHKFKKISPNYTAFPFFAIRPLTVATQLSVHAIENCNLLTKQKSHVFNHLSRFWAPNKYHMHYTIKNHFRHVAKKSALTSYRPVNWVQQAGETRLEINVAALSRLRLMHNAHAAGNPLIHKLYPVDDYVDRADPNHPDHYGIETIADDGFFDTTVLTHPRTIYTDSYLSVVTEVPKGQAITSNGTNHSFNYISEKTVQPILHGHIFVVNAIHGYNTQYLRDTLGFELYDEVFNYNHIERSNSDYIAAYNIVEQMNQFDPACIFDNATTIAEKIFHNRDLLTNPNSRLRQDLRRAFVDILEQYRKLDA